MCRGAPHSFSNAAQPAVFAANNALWSNNFFDQVPAKAQQEAQPVKDEFDFNPFIFTTEPNSAEEVDDDAFFRDILEDIPSDELLFEEPAESITVAQPSNKRFRSESLDLDSPSESEGYPSEHETSTSWSYAPESPTSELSYGSQGEASLHLNDTPVLPYYFNDETSVELEAPVETKDPSLTLEAVKPLVRDESPSQPKKVQVTSSGDQVRSKYKGVRWYKRTCKWVVQIRVNGQRKHIGYFSDEEEAGKAYALAMKQASSGSLDNVHTEPRKTKKARR